jgi:hypothetical protein
METRPRTPYLSTHTNLEDVLPQSPILFEFAKATKIAALSQSSFVLYHIKGEELTETQCSAMDFGRARRARSGA